MPRTTATPDVEDEPGKAQPEAAEDDDLGFYSLDDSEDQINVLYWGRSGTGKTTDALMASNLPGARRVLVVNAEGGVKQIALRKRGIDTSKIVVWPPKGQKISFEKLEALHRRLLSDLLEDPTSWTATVFDSITEIVAALRESATLARQARLDSQDKKYDPNHVDIADYGVMTDQMRRLFRRFRDLPCHTILTALERNDEETGTLGPDLTPALANSVMGYVDFVIYCRATQEATGETEDDQALAEFRGLTRAHSKYHAKDRFDATPRVLADPNFVRLAGYVNGDLVESEDALQQEYNERRMARENAAKEAAAAKKAERLARLSKKTPTGTTPAKTKVEANA